MAKITFTGDFRRTFLTGLAALFPILITVFLLTWLYKQLDRTIGSAVNSICREVIAKNPALFETVFPGASQAVVADLAASRDYALEHFPRFVGVSIGILAALVIVYLIGVLLRSYVGARIVRAVDRFFEAFPVIKAIYPYARRVADFLFGAQRGAGFRRVVVIQYPRKGVYTVGFLTGEGLKDIEESAERDLVTVFIPTSPTPLTGFVVVVPRDEVTEIDMSVEEAFRFCMTAGMVATVRQRPGEENELGRTERPAVQAGTSRGRGLRESATDTLAKEEHTDR